MLIKIKKLCTERNIKIVTIFAGVLLAIGYFINVSTLMSIYDITAKCESTKVCDQSIDKLEKRVDIGNGIIYVGLAILVVDGFMIAEFNAERRKQKKATKKPQK